MALIPEPFADALARADGLIRFEATEGEENGPYDPADFSLIRGEELHRGQRMTVDGKTIAVGFGLDLQPGDEVIS